jgi:hypothetical protein
VITGLVLAALVVTAALAPRLGRPAAVLLAVVSVLWFLVNGPVEGVVLISLTEDHGLTSADLAGVAGLGVAAWVWARG